MVPPGTAEGEGSPNPSPPVDSPSRPAGLARRALPWGFLALVAVLYVMDASAWVHASDPWTWGDGSVHASRTAAYRTWMFEGPGFRDPTGLVPIFGYGPLYYLTAAPFLQFMEVPHFALAAATMLFGTLGLVGVFLTARALAGPSAGGFAALLLATLPLFRLHTWDAMLDVPGASLAILALGALFASEGFRRTGWSVVCGLAFAGTLLVRWPVAAGLFPVVLAVAAHCVQRSYPTHRTLAVAAFLVGAAGIVAGFVYAPEVRPTAVGPASLLGLGLTLAVWFGVGRVGPRPVANLLLAAGLVLALSAPAFLCVRREVLGTVGIHMGTVAIEEAEPGQHLTGASGVALALAQGLRFWELGAVGSVLAGLGLLQALFHPRARWLVAGLLVFCLGTWGFVLSTKFPMLERWLFPAVPALIAIAGAALFVLRLKGGAVIAAAAGLLAMFSAWSWRFPELPGHVAPDRFREEIDLRRGVAGAWVSMAWAFQPQPWGSLLPYRAQPWAIPDAFFQTVRTCQLRIAWRVSPTTLDRLDVGQAVQAFNQQLRRRCPQATSEVPPPERDPWGAGYAAWVLVYDAGAPDLENELTQHVGWPSRFALAPHDGIVAMLATRGVAPPPGPPPPRSP